MRISELVTMLEQVKNEEGDLEIFVDVGDEQVQQIELAEFGAYVKYDEDEAPEGLITNVYSKEQADWESML